MYTMTKKSMFQAVVLAGIFAVSPLLSAPAVAAPVSNVMLTGLVTCSRCSANQMPRKGYTQFSWAVQSVSQGDDILIVAGNVTYKLQGNKDQILKYIAGKATVSGSLDGNVLTVEKIGPAGKSE
jgi:hypothetical protein